MTSRLDGDATPEQVAARETAKLAKPSKAASVERTPAKRAKPSKAASAERTPVKRAKPSKAASAESTQQPEAVAAVRKLIDDELTKLKKEIDANGTKPWMSNYVDLLIKVGVTIDLIAKAVNGASNLF